MAAAGAARGCSPKRASPAVPSPWPLRPRHHARGGRHPRLGKGGSPSGWRSQRHPPPGSWCLPKGPGHPASGRGGEALRLPGLQRPPPFPEARHQRPPGGRTLCRGRFRPPGKGVCCFQPLVSHPHQNRLPSEGPRVFLPPRRQGAPLVGARLCRLCPHYAQYPPPARPCWGRTGWSGSRR